MAKNKQDQFSQGSLQDFSDCQRRYYYRYRMELSWPAAEMEPITEFERLQKMGQDFHLLVQQSLSGVPGAKLQRRASEDADLAEWWQNFEELRLGDLEGEKYPEIVLRARLEESMLVAKYDLIYLSPDGEVVLYDWKTSRRRPDRYALASRWQSILYPYLLARCAGEVWPGYDIHPENIRMVYWFANFPDAPVELQHSSDLQDDHEKSILALIETIRAKEKIDEFPLTEEESRCRYCVYRSLCNRGIEAGTDALDLGDEGLEGFELDIDQIQEIEL